MTPDTYISLLLPTGALTMILLISQLWILWRQKHTKHQFFSVLLFSLAAAGELIMVIFYGIMPRTGHRDRQSLNLSDGIQYWPVKTLKVRVR